MERNLSAYLRQILALCFVLAGLLTFAEQAHCLTMTPGFASAHDVDHEADSYHHMAGENSHCHHDGSRSAQADWTFLHQPKGSGPIPPLASSPAHLDHIILTATPLTDLVVGKRQPPPDRRLDSAPSVLATTARLLI